MLYPERRYNLNFDVCAIVMCIFLLLYLAFAKNLRVRRIRSFFWVALCMLVCSSGELFMDIIRNENGIPFANWQAEIATFFSHIAHNTIPFLLVYYLLSLTGLWHGMNRKQIALMSLPEILLVAFHLIPGIRHQIYYYYGNCQYVRGPLYCTYFIIVTLYMLYGLVILIHNFSSIPKNSRIYVVVLCSGFLIGMAVGMVNQYIRATNFIQTLTMICTFFTLENDAGLLDAQTGVYNTAGLIRDSYPLFRADYRSYILSIKLQHFNYYRLMVGMAGISEILHEIGGWMLSIASENCAFYRVGSGEITVILYHAEESRARAVAKKISDRFAKPWHYSKDHAELTIPAQVWVSSTPDRISSEEQMLSFSEAVFDDNLPQDQIFVADEMKQARRQVEVNVAIRRALADDSFQVYYQPIYDTKEKKIHSCEALVRMHDEKLGDVSPEEFIKVAEQTGTVSKIGSIVFEKVCRFLAEEKPEQYGMDFVEVNLSPMQCMDRWLVSRFESIMEKYDVEPNQIVLEVTESAVIHNEGQVSQVIKDLQNAGFQFALDDFGTGQANYSYLRRFPFSIIKIDKSFLWASDQNEEDQIILRNMLNLSKDLKLETVVEGVETRKQRDQMVDEGVNYLQGFYYSKPIPRDDFVSYIMQFNLD